MNNNLNRKLGVFGPRNSGKTTYWACLYGSKGATDASVSFTHEQTRERLDHLWRSLYDGKVAPATPQAEPQDIFLNLHSDATTWCVSTKDYSGRLVELSQLRRGEAEASGDLRRKIASWVRDCDAMLVLVPADLASQDEMAHVEFRRALEALLEAFRTSDHPGPLPVCLAVTKSDMLPVEPTTTSTPPTEEFPRVLPEWLDELATLVRNQVGEAHTRVFLTSAFGGHASEDPTRPPKTGPRPRGLEAPLRWVLAESSHCLSAPVIAAARRSLERRWFHGFGKALKACDRVAAKGLPAKEREELDELKAQLVERWQRQRRRRVIAGAIIAVLLTLTGLWLHADRLATRAEAVMRAGSTAPESLASVRAFLKSGNPACSVLYKDQQKRAKDWHDARAQEQVVRTKHILSRNADVPELHWRERTERAKVRIKACRDFAQLFPQRKERFEFDHKASRAQALIEKLQVYGPFDDEYAHLVQSIEPASLAQARELVRKFMDSFPQDKYPLRAAAFQRLHSVLDSKAKRDEHARLSMWEARIRANYENDPSQRSGHLEEIEKWLDDYESSGIHDLEPLERGLKDLKREISEDWDREDYRKLRTAAGRMFEGEGKLSEAIQYGEEYLQANRDVIAMQEYVRRWLQYVRSLQKKQRVGIAIKEINVTGSKFDDIGYEKVQVEFWIESPPSSWEGWYGTGVKKFSGKIQLRLEPQPRTVTLCHDSIKLGVSQYDNWFGDDVGKSSKDFLHLLERYQEVGADSAEAHINVDGATVVVVITDLPTRRDLPPYGKRQ